MASVTVTPESVQRLNALNNLRAPSADFEELGGITKTNDKGQRYTQALYRDLSRQIKTMGSDIPVTILNLNPFALKINGGMLFTDEVPACPTDQPYTIHVIRQVKWTHRDRGCDAQGTMQFDPVPVIPLAQAAEYIREYVQQEGGFGGVLCYIGDHHPSTIKKGAMVLVPEVSFDDRGEMYVNRADRDFHQTLEMIRYRRNQSLLKKLQLANSWYENDSQRMNVNDTHRDMARLALKEGIIPELPRWVMQDSMLTEKQPDPCPVCQVVPKANAILCVNCSQVFEVLAAYKLGRVRFDSVDMERLTDQEFKEASKIEEGRKAKRARN